MTTMTADWMPAPGDIVIFPAAPMEFNRSLEYRVLDVEGDSITFTADKGGPYTYDAVRLHAIGMTLKRSRRRPCCLRVSDAGAHRAGCPDHPEGVRG